MSIKFFECTYTEPGKWKLEGLVKMMGSKHYTNFNCSIVQLLNIVSDELHQEMKELIVYEGGLFYQIIPTLGGSKHTDKVKNKGLMVSPSDFNIPGNVWMAMVGSMCTPM